MFPLGGYNIYLVNYDILAEDLGTEEQSLSNDASSKKEKSSNFTAEFTTPTTTWGHGWLLEGTV